MVWDQFITTQCSKSPFFDLIKLVKILQKWSNRRFFKAKCSNKTISMIYMNVIFGQNSHRNNVVQYTMFQRSIFLSKNQIDENTTYLRNGHILRFFRAKSLVGFIFIQYMDKRSHFSVVCFKHQILMSFCSILGIDKRIKIKIFRQ